MILEQLYKSEYQRLVESHVYQDPLFEQWQGVGRVIAERKMTEPEILDLFGKIETGMTNKDTGANRTVLGRGKDKTTKVFTSAKDAFNSVMSSIQNSTPVQAVDVAYDQATDAVANLTGGQRTKVMQAIKGYRNLVKEYPKTAGFAKAALVAIAGLATGGAGLPAIAGLTYALDSAIRGDKLSSVIGKGAGAAAVTWAGQTAADALRGSPAVDSISVPAADSLSPGETIPVTGSEGGKLLSWSQGVGPGDTLSDFAKKYNVSVDELLKANPQITNPDVLQVGSSIQIPTNNFQGDQWGSGLPVYDKGVGTSADTMSKIKTGQYTDSPISQALAKKLKESANFKLLPVDKLIDQKLTVMTWALNESVGKPAGYNVHLTTLGVYTVFENVNRYARAVVKEAVGPDRPDLPDEYRPDMPGGSGGYDKNKKGIVGKGLDWLDRATGKVGSALSNFGHQFTTKVTKEKLKMNWHQAGKPSDSEAISAFLVKQGVPQNVINDVYSSMGIPVSATAPAAGTTSNATATTAPAAGTTSNTTGAPASSTVPGAASSSSVSMGGAQAQLPYYGINPATKKPWTVDELQAKASTTTAPASGQTTTTPSTASQTGTSLAANTPMTPAQIRQQKQQAAAAVAQQQMAAGSTSAPVGFNASNVMNLSSMPKTAGAPTKFPSYGTAGQQGNYKPASVTASTTTALPKPTTTKITPAAPTAPSAPAAPDVPGTYNPRTGAAQMGGKSMVAFKDLPAAVQKKIDPTLAEQVKHMLESVQTKKDVERIREYIDNYYNQTHLTETVKTQRRKLMDHVTKVSAIRRRIYAQSIRN